MIQNLIWPVILQLIAVGVIIAEFILPSAGILTIASLLLFGYSLFLVFTTVSSAAGLVIAIIDIILIPILVITGIKILAASPVTLKKSLSSKEGATAQPLQYETLKGLHGTAITDLRPAGTALLEGHRYDVVSSGDYITKGSEIFVSVVDGNRIVVKQKISN